MANRQLLLYCTLSTPEAFLNRHRTSCRQASGILEGLGDAIRDWHERTLGGVSGGRDGLVRPGAPLSTEDLS